MSYGINLTNQSGQIMFSTDYISYHFVGKYTATDTGSFRCDATFNANGTPIVFIDGNSGTNIVGLMQLQNNGGTSWTATVSGRTSGGNLSSIDIYVFGFPDNPPSSGYSIWCKDSTGATTLNLNQRLLKISGAYQTTSQSSSSTNIVPNQSMTFGSIPSDYIVCCPMVGEISAPAGPNRLLLGMGPYRVNSTTVGLSGTCTYSASGGAPVPSYRIYEQEYVMFADKTIYQ